MQNMDLTGIGEGVDTDGRGVRYRLLIMARPIGPAPPLPAT